jgi:hypothetical protein
MREILSPCFSTHPSQQQSCFRRLDSRIVKTFGISKNMRITLYIIIGVASAIDVALLFLDVAVVEAQSWTLDKKATTKLKPDAMIGQKVADFFLKKVRRFYHGLRRDHS